MTKLLILIGLLCAPQARALAGEIVSDRAPLSLSEQFEAVRRAVRSEAASERAAQCVSCVCTEYGAGSNGELICTHRECGPCLSASSLSGKRSPYAAAAASPLQTIPAEVFADTRAVAADNPNCHLVCIVWNVLGICVNWTPRCP